MKKQLIVMVIFVAALFILYGIRVNSIVDRVENLEQTTKTEQVETEQVETEQTDKISDQSTKTLKLSKADITYRGITIPFDCTLQWALDNNLLTETIIKAQSVTLDEDGGYFYNTDRVEISDLSNGQGGRVEVQGVGLLLVFEDKDYTKNWLDLTLNSILINSNYSDFLDGDINGITLGSDIDDAKKIISNLDDYKNIQGSGVTIYSLDIDNGIIELEFDRDFGLTSIHYTK